MTGDQGTLDSSLGGGGYLTKATNFGPAIFKTIELVSWWEMSWWDFWKRAWFN